MEGAPATATRYVQFRLPLSPLSHTEFQVEGRALRLERAAISRFHAGWVGGGNCPPQLLQRPTRRAMLGYLASWTVHNGGIGGHGVVFPALHAGRHVFAVGLHVEDCELTDEGVAWMLFGGWGGFRPPGGWSANIQEEMAPLRLDARCEGVVVRFVLCAELYFHARDTYEALHAEPAGARLGFMRAAFARLIVGMDSEGRAIPDPIDDAIRVPREAFPPCPEPGPTRQPIHSAAVGALSDGDESDSSSDGSESAPARSPAPAPGRAGRAASARSPPALNTRSRDRQAP